MSTHFGNAWVVGEPYYFGRRPEANSAPADCIVRQFVVACVSCGSLRLRVIAQQDEESGELKVFLSCPRCQSREALPLS